MKLVRDPIGSIRRIRINTVPNSYPHIYPWFGFICPGRDGAKIAQHFNAGKQGDAESEVP